jgi:hypothetical protein
MRYVLLITLAVVGFGIAVAGALSWGIPILYAGLTLASVSAAFAELFRRESRGR